MKRAGARTLVDVDVAARGVLDERHRRERHELRAAEPVVQPRVDVRVARRRRGSSGSRAPGARTPSRPRSEQRRLPSASSLATSRATSCERVGFESRRTHAPRHPLVGEARAEMARLPLPRLDLARARAERPARRRRRCRRLPCSGGRRCAARPPGWRCAGSASRWRPRRRRGPRPAGRSRASQCSAISHATASSACW